MTASRLLRIAAAGAALLAAAGFALLAEDVLRARDRLDGGDAAFRVGSRAVDPWQARAPSLRLTERVLGVEDDLALRRALQLAAVASRTRAGAPRREAERALAAYERTGAERASRSVAATARGILLYDVARARRSQGELLVRSADAFRRAIALDPGNAAAKANLELVLVRTRADRVEDRREASDGRIPDDPGAGVSGTGRGY